MTEIRRFPTEDEEAFRALDQELSTALAVEPSPGFHERSIRRLRDEERSRGRRLWPWLAAAAALVCAVAAVVRLHRDAPAAGGRSAVAADEAPSSTAAVAPRAPDPPALALGSSPRPRPRSAPRRAPSAGAGAPEVLVPPEQQELVLRLVRALERDPIVTGGAPGEQPLAHVVEGDTMHRIDLAPTEVAPIVLTEAVVKPLRIDSNGND